MSTEPKVGLAGPRWRDAADRDRHAQERNRSNGTAAVQAPRDLLELTAERQRCLRLVGEQGSIPVDQLCAMLEIPISEGMQLAYDLKRHGWIGTEMLIQRKFPWAWLREPGIRRAEIRVDGGRPDAAEIPYLWAVNAARLHFAKAVPGGRWICGEFLRRDFRASRVQHVPAAIVEIDDDEGLIRRCAVEVRRSRDVTAAEPDLEYLEEMLGEHVDRYEVVSYFCPRTVYEVLVEANFEATFETLNIHQLGEPEEPDASVSETLLSQLAVHVMSPSGGVLGTRGERGTPRSLVVKGPTVVYEMDVSDLPEEARYAIAETLKRAQLPEVEAVWKKDGGGNLIYCVLCDQGTFRVTRSGWGWRADEVIGEGVFEKRGALPHEIKSQGEQEIDDELWARIDPLLPPQRPHLAKKYPNRAAVAGIVCLLRNRWSGWRNLTPDLGFGTGSRLRGRLRRWEEIGVWDRVEAILREGLPDGEELDWPRLKVHRSGRRSGS